MAARRRKGRRTKALAAGLLPATATAVALTMGTGTAGADTKTQQHIYTDGNENQVTCTISLTRTVPFGGDSQVGEGGTASSGGVNCTEGVNAFIRAEWEDPDGFLITQPAGEENSDGSATLRRYAPIGDPTSFHTFHHVNFDGAPNGCIAGCDLFVTRTK